MQKHREGPRMSAEEQLGKMQLGGEAGAAVAAKPAKEKKAKQPKADKPKQGDGAGGKKKETKLGLTAKKDEDFGEWYSQVCIESEMISYYDVSGCYILRPWSFAIWDEIKNWFDARIKELGVQNAYFPLFITEDVLMTEKEHVEGFAPEVAWVTKSGSSELERPIAIRPTSETVMYPYYAQARTFLGRWDPHPPPPPAAANPLDTPRAPGWIRSHRDLPLRLNQWTNVVRWEFKHPTPFIRSREFLWQEGHTVFATKEEADAEVYTILDLYRRIYEDLLAVPVIKGVKSEKEKFAGALYTTTVEAIGVMLMTHGDDRGAVVPPRVCQEQKAALLAKADELEAALKGAGVRDRRDNYTPGWKYNFWELRGVPLRLELGQKDMEGGVVLTARRDTGEKVSLAWGEVAERVPALLEQIQVELLAAARARFDASIARATNWEDFMAALERNQCVLAPWCDEEEVEEEVKKRSATKDAMGAKTLCIPLEQPELPAGTPCFLSGKPAKNWALWGRSY
eukprot:scaffold7.g3715.t1